MAACALNVSLHGLNKVHCLGRDVRSRVERLEQISDVYTAPPFPGLIGPVFFSQKKPRPIMRAQLATGVIKRAYSTLEVEKYFPSPFLCAAAWSPSNSKPHPSYCSSRSCFQFGFADSRSRRTNLAKIGSAHSCLGPDHVLLTPGGSFVLGDHLEISASLSYHAAPPRRNGDAAQGGEITSFGLEHGIVGRIHRKYRGGIYRGNFAKTMSTDLFRRIFFREDAHVVKANFVEVRLEDVEQDWRRVRGEIFSNKRLQNVAMVPHPTLLAQCF